ncbi:Cell wall assembly regulator [Malassezia psittaci]|uniref:Cell wall assembly regulator n=1 Tax=Malassezia psittaci TaxID=1821823 RepID=A0AAF0F3G8_9BASI|nr:Cell wall assembly regulator [Malassezia psittaci]
MRKGGPVSTAWKKIIRFCDNAYEELRDTLNYGATQQQIEMLQEGIGQSLPAAVCEWLHFCNGQEIESNGSCTDGLFFGLPFLSSESILHEWQFWRQVDNDEQTGANPKLRARMKSCPERYVRREYSCPGWIPLITDHMGNYLGVDLMPDPHGGSAGQVIIFGRDFDMKVVVYGCDGPEGWAKFLQLVANELEAGTTFQLDPPSDSGDEEDTIGYQSYFTGGTSGALGGGSDRTGEPNAGFFLTGEYKNWPVLECWADRSCRQWEVAGLARARPVRAPLPNLNESHDTSVSFASTSNSSLDPMDPLRAATSRNPNKLPQQPLRSRTPTGSPVRKPPQNLKETWRQRAMPAPKPIPDLPTIDDVRAIQSLEQADVGQDASASTQRNGGLNAIRGLASLPFKPNYRTVQGQRIAPRSESLELSFRPSSEDSAKQPIRYSTEDIGDRPSQHSVIVIDGMTGPIDSMSSTSQLIASPDTEIPRDPSASSNSDEQRSEHIVTLDERMSIHA